MADLVIIGIPMSNYVRSIRMLCEEKGVAYTLEPAVPHSAPVKAIHPAGQVPCLRHGDVQIFESQAIATYIDNTFPGPKFFPADTLGLALTLQWVSYGNVKVDRWIMREFIVPTVFADKAKGPDMARINAAVPEIAKVLEAMEGPIAKTGYLAGSALTYADMNVLPMLAILGVFPAGKELLAKHPAIEAYVAKLTARPSFTKTAPPPRPTA